MRVSRDRDDRDGAMRGTVACSPGRANNRVTDREADDGDGEEEEDGEEKARRKGGGSCSAHGSQQYRSIYRLVMVLAVCVSAHVYTTLANSPPTPTCALTKPSAPLPGYPQIPCAERDVSLQRRLPGIVSRRVVIVGVFAPPAGMDLNLH